MVCAFKDAKTDVKQTNFSESLYLTVYLMITLSVLYWKAWMYCQKCCDDLENNKVKEKNVNPESLTLRR